MAERNPSLLPQGTEPGHSRPCCPACKGTEFTGVNIGGTVTFTCRNAPCKNQWQGGLPRIPYDPFQPRPIDPTPLVDYGTNPRTGQIEEIRQRPNTTPEYRKGALVDEDDE